MERKPDLPDGVTICEECGEFYASESTLSDWCEICELYGDEAVFDFGDWIEDVDTALELEEM